MGLARLGGQGFTLYALVTMTAYLFSLHLFNFVLPAGVLAVLVVTLTNWLPGGRGRAGWTGWLTPFLLVFAVNVAVSVLGLTWWGVDGKMTTYGAMLVASALVLFVGRRGWRA